MFDNDASLPEGNSISNNLISGGHGIDYLNNTERYVNAERNLNVLNPGFINRQIDDYRLTPEARKRILNIREPLLGNMGLPRF